MVDNPLLLALPRLLAVLCIVSWLIHPADHAHPRRLTRNSVIYLLTFSGWLLLSCLQTGHAGSSVASWMDTYFKSFIVFLMCLFAIEDATSIVELQNTIVVSTLGLMAVGLYGFISQDGKSTWLEGLMLLAFYVVLGVSIFFIPV